MPEPARKRGTPEAPVRREKIFRCAVRFAVLLCLANLAFSPGHVFAHAGLHEQIQALTKKIAEHPDKAELYLERGRVHSLHQDLDAAMADYEKAEMLSPKLSEVHLARGMLFHQEGWLQAAEAALDRFLAREPDHPIGLAERAAVRFKLHRYIEAAEDYTQAIHKAQRPPPEYYLARAKALAAAGDIYVDRALEGLDEGIKRLGLVGSLMLSAIDLEISRGHYEAALERLDRMMAHFARKERWFAMRGEILQQAGRTDEAREAFLQSIKAIEALPPRHRKTQAMMDLEQHMRQALNRSASPQP